jgi:opacity protein-like surface antigen
MIYACISTSSAQDVKLGAAGFLGTTNWSKEYDDAKTRAVLGIGAAGQYAINDKLSVGAELMYSSVGPSITDDGDGFEGRVAIRTIQIPLFASYEIIDKLEVHAGLQPAAILSVDAHITSGPDEGTYDLSENYGSFNMDFILGGSYDITDNLTGLLRINQGLVDVEKERESRDFKTTGIQLGIRYWFLRK